MATWSKLKAANSLWLCWGADERVLSACDIDGSRDPGRADLALRHYYLSYFSAISFAFISAP